MAETAKRETSMTETDKTTDAYWEQFKVRPPAVRLVRPRLDIAARFREWVDAGRPALEADDTAICASYVKDEDSEDADENGWRECLKVSAFIVERSDFDASFGELGGGAEACEDHLWETVFEMMSGDDSIRAIVTPRWSKAERP